MPVYTSTKEAVAKHPNASYFVNFASFRSVHETTMEALTLPSIKTVCVIAEGVPEQQSREIIKVAEAKGVGMIGPATVGGIKPGCIAYISKSGGMSNELNNLICRNSDGVNE